MSTVRAHWYIRRSLTQLRPQRGLEKSAQANEEESDYDSESDAGDVDALQAVKAEGDEPCKLVSRSAIAHRSVR